MCYYVVVCDIFFFKQKTAYEMRISDWSSDVCSSDLMVYSAQWQDDVTPGTSNNPTPIGANGWGIVNWMPQSAGASDTYIHTVQPPGNRNFDVKMSVRRDGASGPLLAGLYQDVITVTLQPLS